MEVTFVSLILELLSFFHFFPVQNKFFCKVHHILQNHTDAVTDGRDLVRNLHMFLTWKHVSVSS